MHSGRVDDLMNVSGHLLSTAEIESALVLHPDITEAAGIGPAHRVQADLYDTRIIGQGDGFGIREETELPVFSLAVVKDDGALPASFLVVVEFAEVGDDVLARSGFGAHAFDQGVVGVRLTVFGPGVSPQKHKHILSLREQERVFTSRGNFVIRSSLHADFGVSTTNYRRSLGETRRFEAKPTTNCAT